LHHPPRLVAGRRLHALRRWLPPALPRDWVASPAAVRLALPAPPGQLAWLPERASSRHHCSHFALAARPTPHRRRRGCPDLPAVHGKNPSLLPGPAAIDSHEGPYWPSIVLPVLQ